jgi:hypothetical protein
MGDVTLNNVNISISGAFQQSNKCGSDVAPDGGICSIYVTFEPTQLGPASGTLTITDSNGLHGSQTVALSGTGVAAPAFSITNSSGVAVTGLTFANQQPGVPSQPQTLTVTNVGAVAMANIGFAVSGAAAGDYTYTTTCGTTLAASASCTVSVVFTPDATGSAINATLAVTSSTAGVAQVLIGLNGSGLLTSGLTASPADINFPVMPVGQPSAAQSVTITNSSSYAIGALSVAATAPFSVSANGCTAGLAAGANCTVALVFTPTTGGAAGGTLTVSSSAVATPAIVGLLGSGFSFTVAFCSSSGANCPSSESQTVVPGQSAYYTLYITPSGANATFAFTYGTLPSDALCLCSTTMTLKDGVQGNLQVQISTTAATARTETPDRGPRGLWRALPLACGLLLLPLALYRRRRIFLPLLLFVALVCGVSSCASSGGSSGGGGGGSGGSGGSGGTPAGTYTIPVTVSANGVSQTVDLILVVD